MRTGYTTGVFDLFHVGHLRILKKARQLCDHLIVGVTSDELVFSRKGRWPVIQQHERMEILTGISCVSDVVPQNTMDKLSAFKQHKFDIMFVGDDWKHTPQWQTLERSLGPLGVEFVYFPYTLNVSSTKLNSILEHYEDLDWVTAPQKPDVSLTRQIKQSSKLASL